MFLVLNYMGVPSVKDGLWCTFHENGKLTHQILFNRGEIEEFHCFDEDDEIIE